ncbi:hypothetical protein Q3G72_033927 [Acer saccharum]|nr:hypothetical protein Q3G72_033927 [Acer saccharum]
MEHQKHLEGQSKTLIKRLERQRACFEWQHDQTTNVKPRHRGTVKLGSWGGPGGVTWDFNPGSDSSITEIVIAHGDIVDSVSFKSFNRTTGKTVSSGKLGGSGGVIDKISINGKSGEYLTSIRGTTNDFLGIFVVESLTFHTNHNNYGPYGLTNGSAFNIPLENGEVVGFFGRSGIYVDALGIRVTPSTK